MGIFKWFLALAFLTFPAFGMERASGWCEKGGAGVYASSSAGVTPSQRSFQQSYPGCHVDVYLTGTLTHATIYSTNTSTPLTNPFTASSTTGAWFFYAANGVYDVTISGGGLASPFTFGAVSLFDSASFVPLPCGSDTQVQYNHAGSCGADANLVWNYSIGSLAIKATTANDFNIFLDNTIAGFNTGIYFADSASIKWSLFKSNVNGFDLTDVSAGVNVMQFNPGGDAIIHPASGTFRVQGTVGTSTNNLITDGVVLSTGGFTSQVAGGSFSGVQSGTDGALLRGFLLNQNVANTAGGYFDFKPVLYNPFLGSSCTDLNGNLVTQPLALSGGSFASHDTIMWVSTSPQMPPGGSCGTPLPVEEDYGLNINSYFFARGGLATDNASFNAINTIYLSGGVPAGGVTAGVFVAGTLYPAGTVTSTGTLSVPTYLGGYVQVGISDGPPAAGTIASVTNPLVAGDTVEAGTLYYDKGFDCFRGANNALVFSCLSSGGGGGSHGPATSVQTSDGSGGFTSDANLAYTGGGTPILQLLGSGYMSSAGGFQTTGVLTNQIQAPNGGVEAKWHIATDSFFLIDEAAPVISVSGQSRIYSDSTLHWPQLSANASTYLPLAVSDLFANFTSGHCVSANISLGVLSFVDAGGACTVGGGGGTVASSSVNQVAVYSAATTVVGSAGLTFNPTTGVLSVSGGSGPGITAPAASIAGPIQATGSSGAVNVPTAAAYNAISAHAGGIGDILNGTFVNYIQPGSYATTLASGPPLSTSDTAHDGMLSYYTGVTGGGPCLAIRQSGVFACFAGGGGSGTVASALATQIAVYPANGTTVQGFSGFTWNNGSTTLTVAGTGIITTGAFNSSTTGTNVGLTVNSGTFAVLGNGTVTTGGSVTSSVGFNSTNTALNSIQTAGNINGCNAGTASGSAAFSVQGTLIVDCSRNATFVTVVSPLFNSTAVGAAFAFQTNTGSFIVSGAGAVSAAGVISSTGAAGGVGVTTNTAANSMQTVGGVNACLGSSCVSGIAFEVNGVKLVDSSRNAFVQNLTISGTCTGCVSSGVTSITGTVNQVIASAATGAVTLSLPQAIALTSSPQFANLTASSTISSNNTSGGVASFANNNASFSVNGTGGLTTTSSVNANSYQIGGTSVISSSRNLDNINQFDIKSGATSQVQINFTGAGGRFVLNNSGGTTVDSIGASTGFQTVTQMQVYTAGFGSLVWSFTNTGMTINGVAGVTCSGTPTSSFATINGIVTHC